MKILYLNHYAGTPTLGMEYRPHYLAREWKAQGHDVLLIGSRFSHLRQRQPSAWRTREDDVEAWWLPGNTYVGNGVGRIANMFLYVCFLLFLAPLLVLRRPDVVIASSTYPLDVLPAWLVARLGGARLVHEIHDLWPLSPRELGGLSERHPFIRVMQAGEDFACRRVDLAISILPATRTHLVSRGLAPLKFFHVPNGVDEREWGGARVPSTHDSFLEELRAKGAYLVGYLGGHGVSNALETLVDAADLLADEDFVFVFVGKGPEKPGLMARAKANALRSGRKNSVYFLDAVPKAQVPGLLARFDVLCLTWHRSPLYRFGVSPNKIFDYMMSGRPVVQAIEAANDLVADAACGWSCPPEDPAALAAAIKSSRDAGANERAQRGANGQSYVRANHTFGVLARRFLEIVSSRR
jgi:glycosyltransferase involved in cell wall biosynthesis